jgi:hypothetical protein
MLLECPSTIIMALFHQLPYRNDKDKEWEKRMRAAQERAKSAPTAMPFISPRHIYG